MPQHQAKAETPEFLAESRSETGAPLGILAGGGSMPLHVAKAALAQNRSVHIVALKGFASEELCAFPHSWVNIGQIGGMIKALKRNGCRDLVIIGSVLRPNLGEVRIDWGFLANLGGLWALRTAGGDNSVLSRIVAFFESKGLHVQGAHEIAPDLLAEPGPLGRAKASEQDEGDIELGRQAVATLGPLDVGQAVVVARGHIIAVEAAEGTDAVLERCCNLKKWSFGRLGPRVGVLVKCAKPGQDRRVDLPSVGPETVRRAAEAKLTGIAVAAGDVLIAEREETIRLADQHGLFIVGVARPQAALAGEAPSA